MNFEAKKEKEDFKKLCSFIKKSILEYGDDVGFPKSMALRLKGMAHNKHIMHKGDRQIYPYCVILASVKKNKKTLIDNARLDKYKDENHKINYLCVIIEKDLNEILKRYKSFKVQEELKKKKTILEEDVVEIKEDTVVKKRKNNSIIRKDLW